MGIAQIQKCITMMYIKQAASNIYLLMQVEGLATPDGADVDQCGLGAPD